MQTIGWNKHTVQKHTSTLSPLRCVYAVVCIVVLCLSNLSCTDNGAIPDPLPPVADAESFESTIATDWYNLINRSVKSTPGYTAPIAARAYAYAGITLYESVVNGMYVSHRSLVGKLRGFTFSPLPEKNTRYHWMLVANTAMATYMREFFVSAPDSIQQQINALESNIINQRILMGMDTAMLSASKDYGASIAQAIIEYSKTDGAENPWQSNYPISYTVPKGDSLWVPTPPALQPIPLQPYWSKLRTFVASPESIEQLQSLAPPPYSTDRNSVLYKDALAIYEAGVFIKTEQKNIARFWSDEPTQTATSPGHTISILTQLLANEGKNLAFAAEAYALVGIALHDCYVATWSVKYKYNTMRPITYIQQNIDKKWNKPTFTDAIAAQASPDFVCDATAQCAAGMTVMQELFGSLQFIDRTHVSRGLGARYYPSFSRATLECAASKLYGGSSFSFSTSNGEQLGRNIATETMNAIKLRRD